MQIYDVIIVGAGASGFFTAITLAELRPELRIAILERGKEVLTKVKISGGGRCNVTNACSDPKMFTKFYPRGEKELKGPFHSFCSLDMQQWLEEHHVELKTEADARVFPKSNSSQTIIDCFVSLANELQIKVITSCSVQQVFFKSQEKLWRIDTSLKSFQTQYLVMATGSNPKIWDGISQLGHTIVSPVPSLFTFNIKDSRINDLMGVSAKGVGVKILDSKIKSVGDLLITHWGMSGPAILKASAWGAVELHQKNYQFTIEINWTTFENLDKLLVFLTDIKQQWAKKLIGTKSPVELNHRLWLKFLDFCEINSQNKWADINKKQLVMLAKQLVQCQFQVNGKSTFKDEFVTAGGIDLKEVNFKTMESKLFSNLFFTGEILNIDAITGGFNFQNAWTTAYLASQAIAIKEK